jgi:hypothetical protein
MATQAGDARKFVTFRCALDAGFPGCCIARPGRNRLMQQCPPTQQRPADGGQGDGLRDFPLMPERIEYSTYLPAVLEIDGRFLRSSRLDRPGVYGIRVIHHE